jgi:hypothetical protein
MGIDAEQRIVFLVNENYRSTFDVTEQILRQTQERLKEHGAVVMNTTEALQSEEPLELLWTVPAKQPNPQEPIALESTPPSASIRSEQ